MSGGDRCRYPGSISPGTTGGGPWYCREHFGCSDMGAGAAVVARSAAEIPAGMSYSGESMREAARRAFLARGWPDMPPAVAGDDVPGTVLHLTKDPLKRKRDPKDWARRILQREAAGERQPIYAVTSAREALGL
ncbi:MAG: hypothetical protein KGI71_04165 [Patescibacteria group bacterium]|nr:hypothetical protein [Patescibacteria group bacterium]